MRTGALAATAVMAALLATSCGGGSPPPETGAARIGPGTCEVALEHPPVPEAYEMLRSPLAPTAENLAAGRLLYESDARPLPCAGCHGAEGDGRGEAGRHLEPPPTDLACAAFPGVRTDGYLYWVIENGSGIVIDEEPGHARSTVRRPGRRAGITAMPAHRYSLGEEEIWQLVLYVRALAR